MGQLSPVTHSVDSEGIAWIVFDDPSVRANVLNHATLSALRECLTALTAAISENSAAIKALVIVSAKERIFIAGADLNWLGSLSDRTVAFQAAREGQALFESIAQFSVPIVSAIHGACAGGGYELALACSWRLASDAPETRLGLPEVGLGLIPGWGGCSRLPRLIGAKPAVKVILQAKLVSAPDALALGLVDEVVPAAKWKEHAKMTALRLASSPGPVRPVHPAPAADFFQNQRALAQQRRPGQPAAVAVLDVVEQSAGLALAAALHREAEAFGEVAVSEVAKNLQHVFRLKAAARKNTLASWLPTAEGVERPLPFRTIGVIGAGVMGAGLAHCFAAGGYGVILCDADRTAVLRGVSVIRELFAEGVKRGKVTADDAHRMTGGIGITTSLEDFEFCDLVIETITDDAAAKQKVFAELSVILPPECVIASNSSVLALDSLVAQLARPERVVGLHFFNPVSRLSLVEVALGAQTSPATAARAVGLVRSLGKTPVICRATSGNFVSRVLAFYLNEACRLFEEGVEFALIDQAMREWGWPMGPMRVIDEIGVDVAVDIFNGMARAFPERFIANPLCAQMVKAEMRGRKNGSGRGFYSYEGGSERINPAIALLIPRSTGRETAWAAKAIQARLMRVLLDEASCALAEGVVKTAADADLALILGAGFPAFRGGLLHGGNRTAVGKTGGQ